MDFAIIISFRFWKCVFPFGTWCLCFKCLKIWYEKRIENQVNASKSWKNGYLLVYCHRLPTIPTRIQKTFFNLKFEFILYIFIKMQSKDNKDNEKNGKINTKRIYTMKYSRNCCCICCFCHEVVKSKFDSVIFEISNIRICHINIKNSVIASLIACII